MDGACGYMLCPFRLLCAACRVDLASSRGREHVAWRARTPAGCAAAQPSAFAPSVRAQHAQPGETMCVLPRHSDDASVHSTDAYMHCKGSGGRTNLP
eukprot:3685980-Pleurochrysis_carterae.AAC.2